MDEWGLEFDGELGGNFHHGDCYAGKSNCRRARQWRKTKKEWSTNVVSYNRTIWGDNYTGTWAQLSYRTMTIICHKSLLAFLPICSSSFLSFPLLFSEFTAFSFSKYDNLCGYLNTRRATKVRCDTCDLSPNGWVKKEYSPNRSNIAR